jgi:hypothetical protein
MIRIYNEAQRGERPVRAELVTSRAASPPDTDLAITGVMEMEGSFRQAQRAI